MPSLPVLGRQTIVAALAAATSVGLAVAMAAPADAVGTSAPAGITFLSAPPTSAVVGDTYDVQVLDSGATTPVQLYTQDASVCSFSGSVVTFTTAGTCLVEAHQDADSTYAEADAAQLVDVAAAPPVVTATPAARVVVAKVDRVAPTVKIVGVRAGAAYRGAGPRAHCKAHDSQSGVARCTLTVKRHGHVVKVRARAVDHAGNVSHRVVRYRVHVR